MQRINVFFCLFLFSQQNYVSVIIVWITTIFNNKTELDTMHNFFSTFIFENFKILIS